MARSSKKKPYVFDRLLKKVKELNNNPIYQEYLRRMNEFNDILAESSHQIEEYVNSKV